MVRQKASKTYSEDLFPKACSSLDLSLIHILLAVETSTDLLGVSVVNSKGVLSEVTTSRPRVHSAMLLPLSVEALKMADLSIEDIDCFAVSHGPGSFTGLRIGCLLYTSSNRKEDQRAGECK